MILYFLDKNENMISIGNPKSMEDVFRLMHCYLVAHNYTSPYTRLWFEDNAVHIDFGSHSEFFILQNASVDFLNNVFTEN